MGRKQKVQKVNKNQKNFAVQEDFATLRKFRNIGNFRKVAKMAGIFTGVAKIAKMPASLLLASAASVASPIFALMLLFQLELFMNELDS